MTPSRRLRRRLLLGASLLMAVAVIVVSGAPLAQAHAYLVASNPADGAVLVSSPDRLTLTFDEGVVESATSVVLITSNGPQPLTGVTVVQSSADSQTTQVVVPLRSLSRGAYQVTWSTVSADDLHATSGTFGFGVGTSVAAVGWTETSPDVPESLLRTVVFVGLVLGCGAPIASLMLTRRTRRWSRVLTVVGRVVRAAALTAAAGGLLLLGLELLGAPASSFAILHSRYGAWWSVRELGLLLVAAGAHALGRVSSRAALGACGVGVVLAVWAGALLGHSGSGATGSPVRVGLAMAHVLSTGMWLGTLALLVLVVVRSRPAAAETRALFVSFAAVAVPAVGVMVATGLALASGLVGSLDALVLTDYGRLLTIKILVVGALLVAGLTTHRRLRRSQRPVSRLVLAEVAGGLAVLVLTGLVTSGQPALERPITLDPRATASNLVTQKVGDLQEELTLRPNLPGSNVAVLHVADSRRPSPGPVSAVTLVVVGAAGTETRVPATSTGSGSWSASLSLQEWGPVTIRTVVERRGAPVTSGDLSWVTGAPAGTPGPVLSRQPIGVPLQVLAWLVALVVLVVVVRALRDLENDHRRRRRQAERGRERPAEMAAKVLTK